MAVVTGGARRIGRAIALRLHQRGFDIALHYRSSRESAEVLADELCEQRAGSCTLFQADLADPEQVKTLSGEIIAQFHSINLLINNASGFSPTPIATCTPTEFDSMVNANLRGPYFLVQGLLPAMQTGDASIINLLDVHMDRPLRDYSVYCAAKAGLASVTRSLALELAPGVRVNGVSPGAILWPEESGSYDEAMREATIDKTPLRRLGDPGDIAAAVAFLACDAPFVTGQVLVVDGGRVLTD